MEKRKLLKKGYNLGISAIVALCLAGCSKVPSSQNGTQVTMEDSSTAAAEAESTEASLTTGQQATEALETSGLPTEAETSGLPTEAETSDLSTAVETSGLSTEAETSDLSTAVETSEALTEVETSASSVTETQVFFQNEKKYDLKAGDRPDAEWLKKASIQYYVYLDDADKFDCNGFGEIKFDSEVGVSALTDKITGEVRYYTACYLEKEVLDREDSYNEHMYSQLYDVNGELLKDWTEIVYSGGFGDYVRTYEYDSWYSGEYTGDILINPLTGEEISGISNLKKLGLNHVIVNFYSDDVLPKVLDTDGRVCFDLKEVIPKDWSVSDVRVETVYDYIVIWDNSGHNDALYKLYTATGELVAVFSHDSFTYEPGARKLERNYFMFGDCIFDLGSADGEDIKPLNLNGVAYLDDTVAICEETRGEYTTIMRMVDAKTGEAISDYYNEIYYRNADDYGDDIPQTEYFYAYNDVAVYKLDREGNIVTQADVTGFSDISVFADHDAIVCYDYTGKNTCLLDCNLNILVEPGQYSDISPVYTNNSNTLSSSWTESGYWSGYYNINDYYWRYDIIDPDGNTIVRGASVVGLMRNGLIPIKRGQYTGLVDTDGKWVLKVRVQDLTNDD